MEKAITTNTILLIVAVIMVGIILYILWVKGFLPFGVSVDESYCNARLLRACDRGRDTGDYSEVSELLRTCARFYPGWTADPTTPCDPDPAAQNSCEGFCEDYILPIK